MHTCNYRKRHKTRTLELLNDLFENNGRRWKPPTGRGTRRTRQGSAEQPASLAGNDVSSECSSDNPVQPSQANVDGGIEEDEPIDGQQHKNAEMKPNLEPFYGSLPTC